MRIEINGMGLLGLPASVVGFESDFKSLIKKQENIVSSFVAIKKKACNVNGGIGTLQTAVDNLAARIGIEEQTAQALQTVQNKVGDFIDLAHNVDEKVGEMVRQHQEEFYNANPWARPPEPEAEKSWYEKAKYYYNKGKELVEDVKDKIKDNVEKVNEFAKDLAVKWVKQQAETFNTIKQGLDIAVDSIKKGLENAKNWCVEKLEDVKDLAVNWAKQQVENIIKIGNAIDNVVTSISNFIDEHEQQFLELAIGCMVIGVAFIINPALGVAALTCAGIGAATGAAGGAVSHRLETGSWEGSGEAAFEGAATGFMTGSISGVAGEAASGATTAVKVVASTGAGVTGETVHSLTDDGKISSEEGVNIGISGVTSGLSGVISDKITEKIAKKATNDLTKNWAKELIHENVSGGVPGLVEKICNIRNTVKGTIGGAVDGVRDEAINRVIDLFISKSTHGGGGGAISAHGGSGMAF